MGTMNNPAEADLDLAGHRARNAAPSLADDDYVKRSEVEGILNTRNDARYLMRTGGNSPTADIPFAGKTLTGIRDAAAPQEPITKAQLDAAQAADDTRMDGIDSTLTSHAGTLTSLDGRLDGLEPRMTAAEGAIAGLTTVTTGVAPGLKVPWAAGQSVMFQGFGTSGTIIMGTVDPINGLNYAQSPTGIMTATLLGDGVQVGGATIVFFVRVA